MGEKGGSQRTSNTLPEDSRVEKVKPILLLSERNGGGWTIFENNIRLIFDGQLNATDTAIISFIGESVETSISFLNQMLTFILTENGSTRNVQLLPPAQIHNCHSSIITWNWPALIKLNSDSGKGVGVYFLLAHSASYPSSNVLGLMAAMSSLTICLMDAAIRPEGLSWLEAVRANGVKLQHVTVLVMDWNQPNVHLYGARGGRKALSEVVQLAEHRGAVDDFQCYLMPPESSEHFRECLHKFMTTTVGPLYVMPMTIGGESLSFTSYLNIISKWEANETQELEQDAETSESFTEGLPKGVRHVESDNMESQTVSPRQPIKLTLKQYLAKTGGSINCKLGEQQAQMVNQPSNASNIGTVEAILAKYKKTVQTSSSYDRTYSYHQMQLNAVNQDKIKEEGGGDSSQPPKPGSANFLVLQDMEFDMADLQFNSRDGEDALASSDTGAIHLTSHQQRDADVSTSLKIDIKQLAQSPDLVLQRSSANASVSSPTENEKVAQLFESSLQQSLIDKFKHARDHEPSSEEFCYQSAFELTLTNFSDTNFTYDLNSYSFPNLRQFLGTCFAVWRSYIKRLEYLQPTLHPDNYISKINDIQFEDKYFSMEGEHLSALRWKLNSVKEGIISQLEEEKECAEYAMSIAESYFHIEMNVHKRNSHNKILEAFTQSMEFKIPSWEPLFIQQLENKFAKLWQENNRKSKSGNQLEYHGSSVKAQVLEKSEPKEEVVPDLTVVSQCVKLYENEMDLSRKLWIQVENLSQFEELHLLAQDAAEKKLRIENSLRVPNTLYLENLRLEIGHRHEDYREAWRSVHDERVQIEKSKTASNEEKAIKKTEDIKPVQNAKYKSERNTNEIMQSHDSILGQAKPKRTGSSDPSGSSSIFYQEWHGIIIWDFLFILVFVKSSYWQYFL